MTGLNDTDIKLDGSWKLTQAADGDAPLVYDYDCLLQTIKLESITQEGELFYDETWGWSLLDFLHSDDSELIRLEIQQRVRNKLSKYTVIDVDTIEIHVEFVDDTFQIQVLFRFLGREELNNINVDISRINVEVMEND